MLDTDSFEENGPCDAQLMSDGFVVYQEELEKVHYLNPSASAIFELARSGVTVAEMAAYLKETHDLPEAPLEDVKTCAADLVDKGLLKLCS